MRERPPAEWFLAAYFEAREWWHPPHVARPQETVEIPPSELPEFEP